MIRIFKKKKKQRAENDLIDPAHIIEKHSVKELCQTADEYYQKMDNLISIMSKPFRSFKEGPDLLMTLGQLLDGLHMGKAMTVLDFGCGVGWLSRYLNQMGAITISIDCSKTALDAYQGFMKRYPIMGEYIKEPELRYFDGQSFDLPDNCVDRIVCFDAFHHVPNQLTILKEMHRVLRNGGIVGFAEPGRNHSKSPNSQLEMKKYKVLENDIILEEINKLAKQVGFSGIYTRLLSNKNITLDDYLELTHEKTLNKKLKNDLALFNSSKTVFFLEKGKRILDSRGVDGLKADIALIDTGPIVAEKGKPFHLKFKVVNIGSSIWLKDCFRDIGSVRIGGHLYDSNMKLVQISVMRGEIPHDILPGEVVNLKVRFAWPESGSFILSVDMVAEFVAWFEQYGTKNCPVSITIK